MPYNARAAIAMAIYALHCSIQSSSVTGRGSQNAITLQCQGVVYESFLSDMLCHLGVRVAKLQTHLGLRDLGMMHTSLKSMLSSNTFRLSTRSSSCAPTAPLSSRLRTSRHIAYSVASQAPSVNKQWDTDTAKEALANLKVQPEEYAKGTHVLDSIIKIYTVYSR